MEDADLERIKRAKLEGMIKEQQRAQEVAKEPVAELDSAGFDAAISSAPLVLVDFWAEWCGPCKSMHPVFERMAKEHPQIRFARVNVDREQQIAQRFAVQSIPTFIMFKGGAQADRMTGAVGEQGIRAIAKKHLA